MVGAIRGLALVPLLIGMPIFVASPAKAEVCSTISSDADRLACYDRAFPPQPAPDASSVAATSSSSEASSSAPETIEPIFWYQRTSKSAMDDSETVYLTLQATNSVDNRFGGDALPELTVRCLENTTAVTLQFGDHFMSDIEGYGTVTYRIDGKSAQKRDFGASTDNSVLGLWSGGAAIPFIKSLFGAKSLVIRAMPFNESALEATFNVNATEQSVAHLRKVCKW